MIALISPTGARPQAFSLCAKHMKSQTYKGEVLWVVVDDGSPLTTNNVAPDFREGWEIQKIYPVPVWAPGTNSQSRNIKAGLDIVKNYTVEAIFIIEDDDYYKPVYLEEMMKRMAGYLAIGETKTIYYNVACRQIMLNNNEKHSSLFQTAFTPAALYIFESCYGHQFIDAEFWRKIPRGRGCLFSADNLSVGIKGMPGRGGIGAGHRMAQGHPKDISFNYLRNLIGHEAAAQYEGYYTGNRVVQHDILAHKVRRFR